MGTIAINRGEVSADLKAIDSEAKALGNNMSASFKKVGDAVQKFLVVQAAAAATALVGVGVAGVKAFASFDKGMRGVFTLLPDLNDEIRNELTEGVKDLSEELGIASSKVVPALYQAISAGIPQENVLDFIRTAGKAAIGGVTDLETAVDGLTSVVNAYGAETMSASRASDIMFTAVRLGKCVTLDTRVLLSDGRYEEIGKLRDGATVVSFDGVGLVPMRAEWVDRGTKPTVTLRTRLGREIKTTWNHPYLTAVCRHGPQCQGYECKRPQWVPVKDLKVGDRIAVPTHLPYFGTKAIAEEEASLLGLWLAEGSANGGTPRITTTAYGEEVSKWARHFGCHAIEVKAEQKCPSYSISAGPRGGHYTTRPKNEFAERLKQLGLDRCTAGNKHIPQEVFSWDRQSVATLLRWMFNGDGWLIKTTRGGFQVGYCSMSERLIRDVSHLLLRFGIVGRIRKRSQSNAWVWETNRWFEVSRFVEQIGIDRPQAKEVLQHEPEKQRRRSGSIEYDPIVAIEPGTEEPVCDLIVAVLHNFVAEDIVAHNTTMEEFSSSLFQAAPLAAQLGVKFEELAAWMAQLTLQGTPTSVAMTQIRAALSALTRDSTEASKVFLELTGKTFPEFIASGGSVADALDLLRKYSDESGVSLATLFGAVEGSMAVLGVTGDQVDGFRDKIDQMGASAGATEKAYEEMAGGLAQIFAKLGAAWENTLIEIGEALEQSIRDLAKFLDENKEKIADVAVSIFEAVSKGFQWFIDNRVAVVYALGAIATALGLVWAAAHPIPAAIIGVTGGLAVLIGWVNSTRKDIDKLNDTLTTNVDLWSIAAGLIDEIGMEYDMTGGRLALLREAINDLGTSVEQHIRDGMDAGDAISLWRDEVHELLNTYAQTFPEMAEFAQDYLEEFDRAVNAELALRREQEEAAAETATSIELSLGSTIVFITDLTKKIETLGLSLPGFTAKVEEFGETFGLSLTGIADRMGEFGETYEQAVTGATREAANAQKELYDELIADAQQYIQQLQGLTAGTDEWAKVADAALPTLDALKELQRNLLKENLPLADSIQAVIDTLEELVFWTEKFVPTAKTSFGKLIEYGIEWAASWIDNQKRLAFSWEEFSDLLVDTVADLGSIVGESIFEMFEGSLYAAEQYAEDMAYAQEEYLARMDEVQATYIARMEDAQRQYELSRLSATERFIQSVQREGKSYAEREAMIADAVARGLITEEEANAARMRMTDERIEYERSAIGQLEQDVKEAEERKAEEIKKAEEEKAKATEEAEAARAKAAEEAAEKRKQAEKSVLQIVVEVLAAALQAQAAEFAARAGAEAAMAIAHGFALNWAAAGRSAALAAGYTAASVGLFAAAQGLRSWANLAEGGLVVGPTTVVVGEGRHEEAVLPLSDEVFAKVGAGIVEAMGKMSYPDMARWPAYEVPQQIATEINFDGMFNGAIINVRSEADIEDLAAEIHQVFLSKQRGVGAAGVIR